MNVAIPAELEQFVENVIRSGSFADPAEVVAEALRLLEKREHLRRGIRAGVEQLDRGQYTEYDENSVREFLKDIEGEEQQRFADKDSKR